MSSDNKVKRLKKSDFVLVIGLLILAAACFVVIRFVKKEGNTVIIKQNNSVVFQGDLKDDETVSLKHNTVRIKNGKAYMECADCKNQICVKSGKISESGETVVCLPNRVIIEIE